MKRGRGRGETSVGSGCIHRCNSPMPLLMLNFFSIFHFLFLIFLMHFLFFFFSFFGFFSFSPSRFVRQIFARALDHAKGKLVLTKPKTRELQQATDTFSQMQIHFAVVVRDLFYFFSSFFFFFFFLAHTCV